MELKKSKEMCEKKMEERGEARGENEQWTQSSEEEKGCVERKYKLQSHYSKSPWKDGQNHNRVKKGGQKDVSKLNTVSQLMAD